jgi:RHS repeat-associated protein
MPRQIRETFRLNYNYHRYYDPNAARYCTPDPLGLSAAPNHHAYVPNPLRALDPLGLNPCTVAIDAGSGRALASADRSLANRLLAQIGDRQIIMPRTAYNEFQNAVSRLAGPEEKKLAQELMQRVRVVDDNPSARAAALKVTKRSAPRTFKSLAPPTGTASRFSRPTSSSYEAHPPRE